ncbi:hypothetical protein [Flavobacterium kingsejongi]|uniref:YtxH domain-containing protein n=1 Tax=Flavobacterium kingsejongi TaxID=1678728 RepID=A0A2S1LPD2_9FLAO|nr:hypothetical protein [Flavobacterium kingsejongi]AWG25620.1 hypothetical protein FK004_10450 [Flavobacterium kingsejongi]
MSDRKVVLGIAAGVAALGIVSVLVARKKGYLKSDKLSKEAKDISENFKSKLNELKKKAKKDLKAALEEGDSRASKAKEWINKANSIH